MTSLGGTIIPFRDEIYFLWVLTARGKRTELDNYKGQRGWELWK